MENIPHLLNLRGKFNYHTIVNSTHLYGNRYGEGEYIEIEDDVNTKIERLNVIRNHEIINRTRESIRELL